MSRDENDARARATGETRRVLDAVHRAGELGEATDTLTELAGDGAEAARNYARARGLDALEDVAEGVEDVAHAVGDVACTVERAAAAVEAVETIARAVDDLASAVGESGHAPLPEPAFLFETQGDGAARWRVLGADVVEALAAPYEAAVDLATEDLDADPARMLGERCVLTVTRAGLARRVCGLVRRVERLGVAAGRLVAKALVVPALWTLSQRQDSRIYQDMTTVDVVRAVLDRASLYAGEATALRLTGAYARRGYCVQYRETDLDFVRRLLEEEGISFHFDHGGDAERLVLTDDNAAFTPVRTLDGRAAPVAGPGGATARVESVRHLDEGRALVPTGVTLRDDDFTWFGNPAHVTEHEPARDAGPRAVYDYPGRFTLTAWSEGEHRYGGHDGRHRARTRHGEHAAGARAVRGRSNVTGLAPGAVLEVAGEGRTGATRRYVVTRVEHALRAPEAVAHATGREREGRERYRNEFDAVPADVRWVPPRATRRPTVPGLQTARVVARREGEEVSTDHYGRVKVLFPWDREGERGDHTSCWLRVSHAWAGAGFGVHFIPRVGMEVVVGFMEGDPDRPLVVGCVYNAASEQGYEPTQHPTRSAITTRSSPNASGFNELSFEDRAGAEQVYLRAQRDLDELVRHDHATHVLRHQRNAVDGSHTETVGGDQSLTVAGNRTKTVRQVETNTIEKGRTTTVLECDKEIIRGAQQIRVEPHGGAPGDQEVIIAHNRTTAVDNDDLLIVGHRYQLAHRLTTVTVEDDTVVVQSPKKIELRCGDSVVKLLPTGIVIEGSHIELYGSAGPIPSNYSQLTLSGEKAHLASSQRVEIEMGESHLHLSGSASLAGTATHVSSTSGGRVDLTRAVAIKGSTIDLND